MNLVLTLLAGIGPYGWFVAGAAFLIAETLLPGVSLMWFGAAAIAVGGIDLYRPLEWETQVLLFVALSAATVLAGRLFFARRAGDGADRVNRGSLALVGRELTLSEAIVAGSGRAPCGDTVWRVTGPELPAGTRVRVTGADGATLRVEAVERTPAAASPARPGG